MVIFLASQALSTAVSLFHNSPIAIIMAPADPALAARQFRSKSIFPLPNLCKNCGERLADQAEAPLNFSTIRPQERILREFSAKTYREGELSCGPQLIHLLSPLPQS